MKKALCIGINYEGTSSELSGCINDAHNWAAALSARGYHAYTLIEKQATRAVVLSLVGSIISESHRGDSLVITFSGHGTQVPDENGDEADGMDEANCCHDCFDGGLILDDEWWRLFRSKAPGVQIAFISDSCHSGTVARKIRATIPGDVEAKKKFIHYRMLKAGSWKVGGDTRDPQAPRLFEEGGWLKDAEGAARVPWPVLLMSGCQDNEYSYDAVIGGQPCGAFTHAALAALKRMPAGATFNDWFLAIRMKLPSRQWPQTPRLIGSYLKKPALFG